MPALTLISPRQSFSASRGRDGFQIYYQTNPPDDIDAVEVKVEDLPADMENLKKCVGRHAANRGHPMVSSNGYNKKVS